jgi:hypothetical protein
MDSVLLCTERRGLKSVSIYEGGGGVGVYSMNKTESRQNLSRTRVSAARLVTSCSAPSQASILGVKTVYNYGLLGRPENRLKL